MRKIAKSKNAVKTRAAWAKEICAEYNLGVAKFNQGIAHFLETGRKLKASQKALDQTEWQKLINGLPFTLNTAQRLMKIGSDSRLAKICTCATFATGLGHGSRVGKIE